MAKRTGTTPADQGIAAARRDAEQQKAPPTAAEKRALKLETANYMKTYRATSAREAIDQALAQLHSMVDDIEREAQRETNSLAQVLYHIRHNMAWKYANISSTLDHADTAIRELAQAETTIDLLATEQEA